MGDSYCLEVSQQTGREERGMRREIPSLNTKEKIGRGLSSIRDWQDRVR